MDKLDKDENSLNFGSILTAVVLGSSEWSELKSATALIRNSNYYHLFESPDTNFVDKMKAIGKFFSSVFMA